MITYFEFIFHCYDIVILFIIVGRYLGLLGDGGGLIGVGVFCIGVIVAVVCRFRIFSLLGFGCGRIWEENLLLHLSLYSPAILHFPIIATIYPLPLFVSWKFVALTFVAIQDTFRPFLLSFLLSFLFSNTLILMNFFLLYVKLLVIYFLVLLITWHYLFFSDLKAVNWKLKLYIAMNSWRMKISQALLALIFQNFCRSFCLPVREKIFKIQIQPFHLSFLSNLYWKKHFCHQHTVDHLNYHCPNFYSCLTHSLILKKIPDCLHLSYWHWVQNWLFYHYNPHYFCCILSIFPINEVIWIYSLFSIFSKFSNTLIISSSYWKPISALFSQLCLSPFYDARVIIDEIYLAMNLHVFGTIFLMAASIYITSLLMNCKIWKNSMKIF